MRCQAPRALLIPHLSSSHAHQQLKVHRRFFFFLDLMVKRNNYAGKAKQASSISWSRIGRVEEREEGGEGEGRGGAGVELLAYSFRLSLG